MRNECPSILKGIASGGRIYTRLVCPSLKAVCELLSSYQKFFLHLSCIDLFTSATRSDWMIYCMCLTRTVLSMIQVNVDVHHHIPMTPLAPGWATQPRRWTRWFSRDSSQDQSRGRWEFCRAKNICTKTAETWKEWATEKEDDRWWVQLLSFLPLSAWHLPMRLRLGGARIFRTTMTEESLAMRWIQLEAWLESIRSSAGIECRFSTTCATRVDLSTRTQWTFWLGFPW